MYVQSIVYIDCLTRLNDNQTTRWECSNGRLKQRNHSNIRLKRWIRVNSICIQLQSTEITIIVGKHYNSFEPLAIYLWRVIVIHFIRCKPIKRKISLGTFRHNFVSMQTPNSSVFFVVVDFSLISNNSKHKMGEPSYSLHFPPSIVVDMICIKARQLIQKYSDLFIEWIICNSCASSYHIIMIINT